MQRLSLCLLASFALLCSGVAGDSIPCSHIITASDTLFALASTYNLTVADITAINPVKDPNQLKLGQVVFLPCPDDATVTSGASILDLISRRPDMRTLYLALAGAGLADELADPESSFTLFAPTDAAFEMVADQLSTNVSDLLTDSQAVVELLTYHVVPGGALKAADLTNGLNLTTLLEGEFLQVSKPANGSPRIVTSSGQRVSVEEADLQAGNSVVHVLEMVLVPESFGLASPATANNCIHTVVTGDTLFNLAALYQTTVPELVSLNPSLQKNPTLLPLGSDLVVSGECQQA